MAVKSGGNKAVHESIKKRTSEGGRSVRRSGLNKHQKRNFKAYRGQGR